MKKISKIIKDLQTYLKIDTDDKAGLYLTLIFHLVIIIILLAYSIHKQLKTETSFVLDFTAQEELEKRQAHEQMVASVSEELDALIKAAQQQGKTPRNVAVDVNAPLKDDKRSDGRDVYDKARRLQEKLDQSRKDAQKASDSDDNIDLGGENNSAENESYTGPAVISYSLDGRKAMSLPVPAYKCLGAGDVTVTIVVNRKGYVVAEKVMESVSSTDQCLRDYALKAASRSRFSSSKDAPERQGGQIVYRFISQ